MIQPSYALSGHARVASWIRRFPTTTYFALAFGFTWALLPLARTSIAVSVLALLGLVVAALLAAALEGPHARRDLIERMSLWRVPLHWYVAALLVPFVVSISRTIVERLFGVSGPIRFHAITPLALVVFVMVYGEEVGWRGFAMPRLYRGYDFWKSSVMIGALRALWHLPLFFMEGMAEYQHPSSVPVGATSSAAPWPRWCRLTCVEAARARSFRGQTGG